MKCYNFRSVNDMIVVISDAKEGKSYQATVDKARESAIIGKKLGEELEGGLVGAEGYTLKITGGSDLGGFPMRSDVSGPRRVGVILSEGTGIGKNKRGFRAKKAVRGNVISDQIMQVNAIVLKAGSKSLVELFPATEKKKKEDRR
jgi:small subunit ribosomal protein S6e